MTRIRIIQIVLTIGIAVAILDYAAFRVMALHYGGAPSISVFKSIPATGPYFLDEHGHHTEVSRQIFSIIIWQARALIFLWPVAVVCLWLLSRQLKH